LLIPKTDLDGDGRPDLVVWRPSSGTWFAKTSSSGFTNSLTVQLGTQGDVPIFATGSFIDPATVSPSAPGAPAFSADVLTASDISIPTVATERISDDGDSGFATAGTWTRSGGTGSGGDNLFAIGA